VYADSKRMSDTQLSVETCRNSKVYADAEGMSNTLLSVATGRN
jgi:hypothetical protein